MKKGNRYEKEGKNNKKQYLMNHGTFFNDAHSVAFEPANTWKVEEMIKLEKN